MAAQAITGMALYEERCGTCHNAPAAGSRAPDRVALSQRTPESILDALTTGVMTVNAEGLSANQKRNIAEQLAQRPIGSSAAGGVASMTNRCPAKAFANPAGAPSWSGWGVDTGNSRFY